MSEHLNSAQLSQFEKRFEMQFNSVVERLQLRRWSVEQATMYCREVKGQHDPIELATLIYDFVAQPNVPVKIDFTA